MRKITLAFSAFFLTGFLFSTQVFAASDPAAKDKTSLANIKMRMSGGVKRVPVKDSIVLSEDDDVYTYYTYEHDSAGRTSEKRCYNVGPDKIRATSDDTLKYHLVYEYDKEGKPVKDFCYNGMGADNLWFTPDDLETYHSAYEYDSLGNKLRVVRYTKDGAVFDYTAFETDPKGLIVKDAVYKGKGLDNQWLTKDDDIEKYHRFEYDDAGNLVRAMECHVKQNGKGEDGVWFTADDVVSSTKVFSYSAKGFLVDIKKYIGSGPDKKWFTADDVPQYYTVYTYTENVYPGDEINKTEPQGH